ncbi:MULTISPECIES: GNAT family N-acetyltransferase [Pirellulaceae]|nr:MULTISPECIES: GNAT family N-acetyltransferase [Pirellulaceae]
MQVEQATPKTDGVEDAVIAILSQNAQATGFPFRPEPVVLKIEEEGRVIAGLVGFTNWEWLYIETLAVDAAYRGKGLGSKLVEQAERIALERACRGVWVDTFTFQSPEFYSRLGYKPFGQLEDFPQGQRRIFLRKLL